MGDFKILDKLSRENLDRKRYKKIMKIKDKQERISLLQNSLVSFLRLKHLDLEIKLKKLNDKKKKHIILLKANLLPSKINLLQVSFNGKDFKKIDSLLNKLEEEVVNV